MGVSIYARKGKEIVAVESVDVSYGYFCGLMSELGFVAETPEGICGSLPLIFFRDALEANWNGMFPEHTILLLKLCRLGLEQGADTISWS